MFKEDKNRFNDDNRNRQMAAEGDALIALWDGKSRGTANMIQEAKKRGLPVHIHQI